jgi:hypothetical protein
VDFVSGVQETVEIVHIGCISEKSIRSFVVRVASPVSGAAEELIRGNRRLRGHLRRTLDDIRSTSRAIYDSFSKESFDSQIPIIINNFNRLESLRNLLSWLQRRGHNNITILDNGSTYPPLMNFYERCNIRIVRGRNNGPYALWLTPEWNRISNKYYVYTDADVVPDEQCPADTLPYLFDLLTKKPFFHKIGLGLRIDDIPDSYAKKDSVISWEEQYWEKSIGAGLYEARVDTTFALYRPQARGGFWLRAMRTGSPYLARHTPWYESSTHPSEEEAFYQNNALRGTSTWSGEHKGIIIDEGQRFLRRLYSSFGRPKL